MTKANIVEMTIALVDKIGRENTEWLAECYPELFETPIEAWKVEEFFTLYNDMDELREDYDDCGDDLSDDDFLEILSEQMLVLWDAGLSGILVIE